IKASLLIFKNLLILKKRKLIERKIKTKKSEFKDKTQKQKKALLRGPFGYRKVSFVSVYELT
ncbi:hypothetical protein, partial [Proteus terrae]|uniref:hypothetical protein n=1 Tax=Proteus terrae TaxID=1574161 RepID=UPI001F47623F